MRPAARRASAALALNAALLSSPTTSSSGAARPEAARVQIIVVESRGQAEQVRAALESGADFAAVAKERSIDPSATNGGHLGELRLTSLRADLQEALRAVAPGRITAVTPVPTGHAILRIVPEEPKPGAGAPPSVGAPPLGASGGLPQFGGVRYPPNTSGTFDVEALFRAMPKPPGWNSDLGLLCELHRATPHVAVERLSELLDGDPNVASKMAPNDLQLAYYMRAVLESSQGRLDQAIGQWEKAYQLARAKLPASAPVLEEVLGSAHFHKAEMENGLYRSPGDRCLFPPRPGGPSWRFEKTADAEKAAAYFTKFLEKKPDDIEVRWLLNLAYLTLGRYPDGVPPKYLVAPGLWKSKADIGRFTDVAPEAGLGREIYISGGMLVDDFRGSGLYDVVTGSYDACEHFRYFRNEGNGTFSDQSVSSGLSKVAGGQGLFQADYDNDGDLDFLVLRGSWQVPMPLSLVRNDGDGTFTEVTREAGLRDLLYATQTAAWADVDADGWIDVFVGNEQGPSQLFRNRRDGTFANVSREAGVDRTSFVKGVVAEDYDNDGDPDFFVSNMRGENWLYRNDGGWRFSEVAQRAGVSRSLASFATWFFDYDNDGRPDLFVVSDYAAVEETLRGQLGRPINVAPSKLYRNEGNGTFTDVSEKVGLDKAYIPMGANFGDVDTDGYLDIYLGTGAPDYGSLAPNVLLRNDAGQAFVDISESSGTGELHKTHGIAFADLENRGHQDMVVSVGGAVPSDAHALRLFRNPGSGNDWISLKLVGVRTNRAALGARITVTVKNAGRATRTVCRTVTSGGSFGTSPLEQHIGLGPSARVVAVEIFWPTSGTRQRFENVGVDQFLEIREGDDTLAKRSRKAYRLGAGGEVAAR